MTGSPGILIFMWVLFLFKTDLKKNKTKDAEALNTLEKYTNLDLEIFFNLSLNSGMPQYMLRVHSAGDTI